jgi:polysaccharide pyruvyl transferase WcaK-like protein
MKTVFYEGWIGSKNIGDEACFEAIKALLGDEYKFVPCIKQKSIDDPPDLYILGGGTILRACDPSIKRRWPDVPLVVWGSGVEKYGVDVGGEIHENFYKTVNEATLIGTRGQISHQFILEKTGKNVEIIGDSALYLNIDMKIENTGLKTKRIAFNIGDTGSYMYGTIGDLVIKARELVDHLKNLKYEIVLFSMWPKDIPILKRMLDEKIVMPNTSVELMKFFRTCRFVVGEKLHTSVLAAAAGVPFISLAYREKCLDFISSIESPAKDWYVRTHENLLRVIDRIHEIEEEYGNNTLLLQNAVTYYRMLQLDFTRRVKEI